MTNMASCGTSPRSLHSLFPQLLTRECLIEILKQRYITHVKLEDLDNEELLGVYYTYIIPLPQRKYRTNRHGQQMTSKQRLIDKKRKCRAEDGTEDGAKKEKLENTNEGNRSGLFSSFAGLSQGERGSQTKPPQSCINYERKTIKLSSSSSKPGGDGSSSVTPKKTTKRPSSSALSLTEGVPVNKKLEKKSKSERKDIENDRKKSLLNEEQTYPVISKKKIARITWP